MKSSREKYNLRSSIRTLVAFPAQNPALLLFVEISVSTLSKGNICAFIRRKGTKARNVFKVLSCSKQSLPSCGFNIALLRREARLKIEAPFLCRKGQNREMSAVSSFNFRTQSSVYFFKGRIWDWEVGVPCFICSVVSAHKLCFEAWSLKRRDRRTFQADSAVRQFRAW